jgi:tetratricopeptide (TPR) repeat protein
MTTTKGTKTAKLSKSKTPNLAGPPIGQQLLQDLQKELGKRDFANVGELQEFMQGLMGQVMKPSQADLEADTLKDEAQDLAFAAMEAKTKAQARKLAKQALAKDPDCVDALVVLASIEADSPQQMIKSLQKAVEAGERSLGANFIKKNKGHFWGLIETRPYMRTLEQLASLLRAEGDKKEAIKQYEKMLELNPNDNQGVRDQLLGLYLSIGGIDEAGKLLADYKDDASACFAWGRVLERFLDGDLPGAEAALKEARKTNRFVELYLSGQKELPEFLPNMYSPGSDEEAMLCLDNLALAWMEFPEALVWLIEQVAKDAVQKKTASRKPKVVRINSRRQ